MFFERLIEAHEYARLESLRTHQAHVPVVAHRLTIDGDVPGYTVVLAKKRWRNKGTRRKVK